MALDKAIESGREHRKIYYGSKAFDPSCRNHGGCNWCLGNRQHKYLKKEQKYDDELKNYLKGEDDFG
jgi:hypothetical protein